MTVRRLEGRVAIITGAARGQGRAAALRLAEDGAALALTDIEERGLEETAAAVRAAGGQALPVAGDVTDPATHERLVEVTLEAYSRIDVLHNNAGIAPSKPLESYTATDFDRIMQVNCFSQVLAIQRVLPVMRQAGRGSIINVSSVGGLMALPQMSVYCASKFAVIGLTKAVAYEAAPDGVRCNAVCPGGIDTPMADDVLSRFADRDAALALLTGRQLFKRFGDPREVADVVAFLASDDASFITGAALPVEGGALAW